MDRPTTAVVQPLNLILGLIVRAVGVSIGIAALLTAAVAAF
jgi:hypothetical protein